MTGKLTVGHGGHLTGPARITYNIPWPCPNGSWGSGAMMGVLEHTMVGDLPGTVIWFNNPAAQASAHFGVAQDGEVCQFGPVGAGWVAWHAAQANDRWYGIEFADDGNPGNPLTREQVIAAAQLVECLSAFAGFPLQVSDSPSVHGFGWHGMGGEAWGGHFDCPGDVRKAQRPQIVALAMAIRSGEAPPAPPKPAPAPAPPSIPAWQETMMNKLPVLQEGAADHAGAVCYVHRMQALVKAVGEIKNLDLAVCQEITATFDATTKAAVQQVQASFNLAADGIVGPQTWGALVTGAP